MAKRDYYEVLGVQKKATADEIRKAHRKLVRQYHPDANKGNPQSEEKFKEVQEAYEVLSDPEKRKNYDQFGHGGVGAGAAGFGGGSPGGGPGGDPFEAFRRAQGQQRGRGSQWQAGPNVSVEDFETEGGGFGDLFEQFFGAKNRGGGGGAAGRGGRSKPQPERGQDIEYPVTLTFEKAARGMTLPLQINRDGKIETIEVKVPPGVKEGSRVRIKGRGQHSNGEPGDLFIVTKVLPHPYFRREGLDIYIDLPLSLYEAALGTKVEVPTLDGPVTLTIPPGTSSGAKLRIKGRGIERGQEKGDEFVVTKIIIPKTFDDEDRELIKQLQAKHPVDARADVQW